MNWLALCCTFFLFSFSSSQPNTWKWDANIDGAQPPFVGKKIKEIKEMNERMKESGKRKTKRICKLVNN